MKLTNNFHKIEFESRDGSEMPKDVLKNIKIVAEGLQTIRDVIGLPITVNSAYRSPAHNKAVGGVSNSYHVKGLAADIVVKGMSTTELGKIIIKLIKTNKIPNGGLGIYKTFVHYDIAYNGKYLRRWGKRIIF